jgi:hypothetical protein
MFFIGIVIVAWVLYFAGHKVSALVVFFFFVTSGVNLVSEEWMDIRWFSKGMDYAILLLAGMVIVDSFRIKNYLKPDKLLGFIFLFFAFLGLCVIYNREVVGTGWTEIIRTARYNGLWIAYFVFRNLSKDQLLRLLKCLFWVTVGCSALYLLQILLNETILTGGGKGPFMLFGRKFPRFYNHPDMLLIFIFMALYFNPCKGWLKKATAALLVLTLLGGFHRSLIIGFLLAVSVGYILRLPQVKRVTVVTSVAVFALFFISFFGYKLAHSRTIKDVGLIASGEISVSELDAMDLETLQSSTFTFRIVHMLERNLYLLEHPITQLFGAGLMTEDSRLTDSMFNFDVGLIDELSGNTVQLDTGDMSYSILLLRYGYVGTALALSLYLFLMVCFYRNRRDPVGFFSFIYFILLLFITFFSQILILPISFLVPLVSYAIVQKNRMENVPANE